MESVQVEPFYLGCLAHASYFMPELRLRLSGDRVQFTHTVMDGGRRAITGEAAGRGLVRVRLRNLAPWSIHLLA